MRVVNCQRWCAAALFVWAKPIIEKLKDMNRRGAFSQYLASSRQTLSVLFMRCGVQMQQLNAFRHVDMVEMLKFRRSIGTRKKGG